MLHADARASSLCWATIWFQARTRCAFTSFTDSKFPLLWCNKSPREAPIEARRKLRLEGCDSNGLFRALLVVSTASNEVPGDEAVPPPGEAAAALPAVPVLGAGFSRAVPPAPGGIAGLVIGGKYLSLRISSLRHTSSSAFTMPIKCTNSGYPSSVDPS